MQFGKGKSNPPAFILSGLIALPVVLIVNYFHPLNVIKFFALLSGLYGTVLLASAFSPQGEVPPQGNIWQRIAWFFTPQGPVAVQYNRPAYHIALILIFISFVLNATGYVPQMRVPGQPSLKTQASRECACQCVDVYLKCSTICSRMIGGAPPEGYYNQCLINCATAWGDCYKTCD